MFKLGVDASVLNRERTGVGNYVFNLLTRYRRVRPETSLYLFSNDRVDAEAATLGECIEHVPSPLKKGPLWLSTGLPPLLEKCGVDVFWGGNGYLPLRVPNGVRRVVTIHDLVYLHAAHTLPAVSRWSRRLLQPLAVRHADAVVCVSQSTADEVHRRYGRSADAVLEPLMDPSYRPATPDEVRAVRSRYSLPERFLLTLGTMEPRKNLAALLEAYVRARERGADLPLLVLAGKMGWLAQDIAALVESSVRRGFAKFLGYVPLEHMPALYSAAEAFVFVPLYEGFGMPAREALLCGTPVIASDIAALREATRGHALLVPPDERSLEEALLAYASGARRPVPPPAGDALQSDHVPLAFAELLERVRGAR
ncbi:MAG TPA: glycosyltransferase family 1 protein [Gammaproteobacteria bacterium]